VQSVSNTSSFGRDTARNGEAALGERRRGEASMARLQEQEAEEDCRSMVQRQQCVARGEGPGPWQQSAAGDGEALLGGAAARRSLRRRRARPLIHSAVTAAVTFRGAREVGKLGRKGRDQRGAGGPTCRHRAIVGWWLRYGSFD
jgi:hypothetical protein